MKKKLLLLTTIILSAFLCLNMNKCEQEEIVPTGSLSVTVTGVSDGGETYKIRVLHNTKEYTTVESGTTASTTINESFSSIPLGTVSVHATVDLGGGNYEVAYKSGIVISGSESTTIAAVDLTSFSFTLQFPGTTPTGVTYCFWLSSSITPALGNFRSDNIVTITSGTITGISRTVSNGYTEGTTWPLPMPNKTYSVYCFVDSDADGYPDYGDEYESGQTGIVPTDGGTYTMPTLVPIVY